MSRNYVAVSVSVWSTAFCHIIVLKSCPIIKRVPPSLNAYQYFICIWRFKIIMSLIDNINVE
jgi:hypothetical protein